MNQVKKVIAYVAATAEAAKVLVDVYEKYRANVKEIKDNSCSGPTVDA
ncbi:hypothetical protein FSU_2021 [Fibrobacter succinogenes subsp. succinogenes S85]|jgi:hypothetical protein|uniref:Uncharacterized protein n=1 Tax=Fibrobacter succinogenes (strain ATCC 19169 / S85) TaxID=59374 RepID=C9RRF0_FIBSS|nr:hypothetical protein [Fibrobacter succinogenes]ACX75136.1 hypothetical protein Fisuc_1539 [Fibrobacter succinogenes subsp. succinogenes S85]ADL25505.1 hypothetical protein FSU_2021 [Fibrobacter succinogenes subsp. succinogenes S85]